MSQETSKWLNTMTLIGNVAKRGKAWHYRASDQGAESNHYDGPIPEKDIIRRLFDWQPIIATSGAFWDEAVDGSLITRQRKFNNRITLLHPKTLDRLGEFTDGFTVHPYDEWLVGNTKLLLDNGELGYSSAGLLKKGAQAWVQVEFPETMEVEGTGILHRPFITAATSMDGSLATSYTRGTQLVVCDNTLAAAMGETDKLQVKRRHSKGSLGNLPEIRDALQIMYETADGVDAELRALVESTVTDQQWDAFLDAHLGERPEPGSTPAEKRAMTRYENRRDQFQNLWDNDMRCAPWRNTKFGALQVVSTHAHHVATVSQRQGEDEVSRAERNMEKMVGGDFYKLDQETLDELNRVLAAA